MKKTGLFLGLLFLVGSAVVFTKYQETLNNSNVSQGQESGDEVLGSESEDNQTSIEINSKSYQVVWFKAEGEQIYLLPNFESKTTFGNIVSQNSCISAINGGFYDVDNTHIGLFLTEGEVLYPFEKNSLHNGIFSVNYLDTPRITRETPRDPLRIAFQTGPILVENDQVLKLTSVSEKRARRMIAAVTGENIPLFMAVYDNHSVYDGPSLKELPEIVQKIEERLNVNIADAVNLDGGSASAFYSEHSSLKEISSVGSVVCVK